MKNLIISVASLLMVTACVPNVKKSDYFPLSKGLEWHYVVTEQHTGNAEPYDFFIKNLGLSQKTFSDKYFEMPVYVRQDSSGTSYYLIKAPDGVFRIAQQYIKDRTHIYDKRERKVLPSIDNFSSSDTWYVESRTYALRGVAVDTVPDAEDLYFDMEYEVDSTNVTVDVPAGRYEGCIKLVARATFSLYADPKLGYLDIDIKQTEWYAPGVGLVKLLREEPKQAGLFSGGNIVFELTSVTH